MSLVLMCSEMDAEESGKQDEMGRKAEACLNDMCLQDVLQFKEKTSFSKENKVLLLP